MIAKAWRITRWGIKGLLLLSAGLVLVSWILGGLTSTRLISFHPFGGQYISVYNYGWMVSVTWIRCPDWQSAQALKTRQNEWKFAGGPGLGFSPGPSFHPYNIPFRVMFNWEEPLNIINRTITPSGNSTQTRQFSIRYNRFQMPYPLMLGLLLTYPGLSLLMILAARRRRRFRRRSNLCIRCGYDLRGCPTSICPECGQDAETLPPPRQPSDV